MLLSVIIPVYNAEKYLQSTVESVLAQDCNDFEVILVDDGSKDTSALMCDKLADEFENVRVIHKVNGGVSSARNVGIDTAICKYITFVDADDRVAEHMFSDMLSEGERKNADKVFCGFTEIHGNSSQNILIASLPSRQVLDREFIINTMLYTGCSQDSYMNSACGSLYRTELIREHNLRFENRPMGEDWLFNMQYCDIIQSAIYINKPYYMYMRNDTSATALFQPRQFELWLENRRFRNLLSQKYRFEIDERKRDTKWIVKILFYAIEVIKHDNNYKDRLAEIFRNNEVVRALNNTKQINPRFFCPVVWLLKNNLLPMAITLLRAYSLRTGKSNS